MLGGFQHFEVFRYSLWSACYFFLSILTFSGNMFLVLAKKHETREEGGLRPKGGPKVAPNRA
jgi:hypothetical protein